MRAFGFAVCLFIRASSVTAGELEQLRYNHPGLIVDLGVGLWAWPVPCDADGDGDFDLLVSCPDKPSNGVYFFENAAGDTARCKMPVFKPARQLSRTTRYVMPSYVDGRLRVLSPGFEYQNFERTGIDEKTKHAVSPYFYKPQGPQTKGPRVRHHQWRYADYDGDGRQDVIVGIEDWSYYGWDDAYDAAGVWQNGPLHGFVFVFRALDDGSYAEPLQVEADGRPVDVFGCPSPNFVDFDRDGDLDLLCGEFLDGFTYFENVGKRREPCYAAGRRLKNEDGSPLVMDLEMIVPVAFDWDRDGDADLVVGDEDGRVALVENTGRLVDRVPQFLRPQYFQQEADTLKCGALATPAGCDFDGDGDVDLLSGNTAGYVDFFENLSGPGVEHPRWSAPRHLEADGRVIRPTAGPNGSIQGPAEAKWGYSAVSAADWNGDGLPDLLLNSILGRVVWYENVGTRSTPRLAAARPIEVEWKGEQPALGYGWLRPQGKSLLTQWRTTPAAVDWNGDGLVDLVMLDHEGYLAWFERIRRDGRLLLSPPQRVLCNTKGEPLKLSLGTAGRSGRRKLCIVDWDGDGRLDVLLNSSSADFWRQTEARDGRWFFHNEGPLVRQNIEGHDVCPTTVDFNGDGLPDFVGGAEDGRFYYLRNPRTK